MLTIEQPGTASPRTVYTQALGKGRALIPEMRLLLEAWQPGQSEPSLADRVLRHDVIGKSTARRVLDVVRVFSSLLQPTDDAARHLKPLVEPTAPRQVFSDILFYYVARQDALLWDFTVLRYWPAVREGRLTMPNREVAELIWEAEQDGRIARPWSAEIKRDMAGRVLGTLSDFGLLEEFKPATRRIAAYRAADGTVLYLATLLHIQGCPEGLLAGVGLSVVRTRARRCLATFGSSRRRRLADRAARRRGGPHHLALFRSRGSSSCPHWTSMTPSLSSRLDWSMEGAQCVSNRPVLLLRLPTRAGDRGQAPPVAVERAAAERRDGRRSAVVIGHRVAAD